MDVAWRPKGCLGNLWWVRRRRCFIVRRRDEQRIDALTGDHFKRFMLRGLDKVMIETGLLAIAHNLRKRVA